MNWKLILAIIVIGVALVALCLYIGYLGYSPFDQFYSWVTGTTQNIDLNQLTSDPTTLVTTATAGIGSATAVGSVLASKLNTVKQQATDTVSAAKTEIATLTAEKDKITTELSNYKTEAETYKQQLTDAQTELTQLKTDTTDAASTISSLESQVQAVQDQNSQFVKSLMSAANGALVTNPIDGKIYSVLKLPAEVQVK